MSYLIQGIALYRPAELTGQAALLFWDPIPEARRGSTSAPVGHETPRPSTQCWLLIQYLQNMRTYQIRRRNKS